MFHISKSIAIIIGFKKATFKIYSLNDFKQEFFIFSVDINQARKTNIYAFFKKFIFLFVT